MATGHIFKRSIDAGAPLLRNVAGDLIAVLDWALDVASGTHWQKVYTSTNKAVYRATTGQRYYLRVDDTGTTLAVVRGYATMTAVDTGTGIFPDAAQRVSPAYYFYKASNATAREYAIVGDSRFFALLGSGGTGVERFPLLFGEASPLDAADSFHTMLMASNAINIAASQEGSIFGNTTETATIQDRIYWAVTADGLNASSNGGISSGAGVVAGGGGALTAAPTPEIIPVRAWDSLRNSSVTSGYVRAIVPYLYCLPYSYNAGLLLQDSQITVGASTFRAYVAANSAPYAMLRTSNNEPGRV